MTLKFFSKLENYTLRLSSLRNIEPVTSLFIGKFAEAVFITTEILEICKMLVHMDVINFLLNLIVFFQKTKACIN